MVGKPNDFYGTAIIYTFIDVFMESIASFYQHIKTEIKYDTMDI